MSQMLASPYTTFAVNLAIDVLLKATIILAIAGLATWCLRKASAAVRHAVWSVALGSLLALPLLSASLPAWRLESVYVSVSEEAGLTGGDALRDGGSAENGVPVALRTSEESRALVGKDPSADPRTAGAVQAGSGERGSAGPSAARIVLLIWAVGVLVLLGRLAFDALRVRGIARRAKGCGSTDVCALAEELALRLGIRRRIRVLVSEEVAVPLTWGVWIPAVILPKAMASWSMERKRIVLLHELAHVARWDYAVLLMVELVCAVYWFNPLVWLAARLNALERERACDDQALHLGVRSDVYAVHLFEIAHAQIAGRAPRGAFAMAQPSSLARRFHSILARGLDRAPISQRQLVSASLTALAVAFPLASIEIWGAVQEGDAVAMRVQQLQDDDPIVRRYAAWALGELENTRGVRPLIERLEDADADVRLVAAWALGEIKDYMAIQPLIERLEDEDPLVREIAALSLGEIEHPAAVTALLEALQQHRELRGPVIWALGEIGGREANAARAAVFAEWGRAPWDNDEVWTGRLGSDAARPLARELSALIAALRDDDSRMRRSAAEWLGIRGDERAVDPLLDTLRDPQPPVRAMAIWALDEINPSRHYHSH
jgi:beta-lactamase regulating signal transducer with metallopeptidase domain